MHLSPIDLQNHQNTFAAGAEAAILRIAKRIPIHPPNGVVRAGHFTAKAPPVPHQPAPSVNDRGHVLFSKQKMVALADRVAFVKFQNETSPGEKGALSFSAEYPDEVLPGNRGGLLPIWWLPWNGMGALVKLKIEPSTTPNLNFGGTMGNCANPDLFFTAAINGCSIFVRGDHDGPSVYHAGFNGDVVAAVGPDNAQRLGGTSENIWRSLMEGAFYSKDAMVPKTLADHTGGQLKQNKGTFGEANKSDYIAERLGAKKYVQGYDYLDGIKKKSTHQAVAFQQWSENDQPGHGFSLSPWGCVFGVRTGNAWKFFLQRNATVIWGTARPKKSLFGKRFGDLESTGAPQVNVVTFGYQEFFPGAGVAHYRDFQRIVYYQ